MPNTSYLYIQLSNYKKNNESTDQATKKKMKIFFYCRHFESVMYEIGNKTVS